jgi:hypothetical protein
MTSNSNSIILGYIGNEKWFVEGDASYPYFCNLERNWLNEGWKATTLDLDGVWNWIQQFNIATLKFSINDGFDVELNIEETAKLFKLISPHIQHLELYGFDDEGDASLFYDSGLFEYLPESCSFESFVKSYKMSDFVPPYNYVDLLPDIGSYEGQYVQGTSNVVIGPSIETGVTVTRPTLNKGFIGVTIGFSIFFVGGLIAVTLLIWWTNRPTLAPPIPTTNDNIGSFSTSGCDVNTWGLNCQNEVHDSTFFSVGHPSNFSTDTLYSTHTENKRSCSDLCKSISGCHGFLYDNGDCELVSSIHTESVHHSIHTDAKLYLTSKKHVHFKDKIFLGKYEGSLPNRFWMVDSADGYQQLPSGQVVRIKFLPSFIKTDRERMGIYALYKFTQYQLQSILKQGPSSRHMFHNSNLPLELPVSWLGKKIWVYYS